VQGRRGDIISPLKQQKSIG